MTKTLSLQLQAPLSGVIIPIDKVPDPVFAQRIVGDGIALDPTDQILLAPCAGTISQIHPSSHAISIETQEGAQILLHIGLDTVGLKGDGFAVKVAVGDLVSAGQALIEFDADRIAAKARSLISVMVITDAPAHELKKLQSRPLAQAGDDILLQLHFKPAEVTADTASSRERVESELVTIHLESGLHARPAALLVGAAKKYRSTLTLKTADASVNAKSVVALLGLGLSSGDKVSFVAEGMDAELAATDLARFLSDLREEAPPPAPARESDTSLATKPSSPSIITGVRASPGLAIGRVHQLRLEAFVISEHAASPADEKLSLARALTEAGAELEDLHHQLQKKTDAAQAAIFAAHQELLEDPDLIQLATSLIEQGKTAAFAWNEATGTHAARLARLNNELMANRANDLQDIGRRVLRQLLVPQAATATALSSDTILIAENLTPSDTVQLDRGKVLGFCTVMGGATTHVAILARSLGIPALAGVEKRALDLPEGTEVVLDGDLGEIRLNPSDDEKRRIRLGQDEQLARRKEALLHAAQPATTRDGTRIEVAANISGVADARKAVEMGCDGVGLLRSEFLFLERRSAPSEEEQYRVYQEIADILGKRPLVIRTLDIGGDKPLNYLPLPPEENPFLGVRGLRVAMLKPEILREQLRAILRVKSQGELHVMFPMVSSLEELQWAKAILEEERQKLGAAKIQLGIMIEVPSAALIADALAREVDFFSIGTNDLTQYTLAMDRGHKDLTRQVDGFHPSVLKLIAMTSEAARRHGKWVGVCGGLAGETQAVPLLVGMGITELSVSIPAVPLVKSQVRSMTFSQATMLAGKALGLSSAKDVRELSTRI